MGQAKTVWELDPHTKAKHVILRKYLNAWLPKLTRWNGRVVICDGFAGPGRYSHGEEGSPIIALNAYIEHDYQAKMKAEVKYLFIESNEKRCESLKFVLEEMELPPKVTAWVEHNEYENALRRLLDYLDEKGSQLAPTFAFIDPFGVKQIPLNIIKRLMKHPKCEVLITFMLSALHRFIASPEFEEHNTRLFGCEDWRAATEVSGRVRENYFRSLYQRQLEGPVGAKYVRYFTMRDTKKKTIYDLFFATNHEAGIDAMKDAMWQIDQSGGYSFSDATDPQQETLFTATPDWDQLFAMLQSQFGGTEQPWPVVEETIRRTPFRILKRPLQAESKREPSRFRIINPEGVRKGALEDTTRIAFPA